MKSRNNDDVVKEPTYVAESLNIEFTPTEPLTKIPFVETVLREMTFEVQVTPTDDFMKWINGQYYNKENQEKWK